jgi:hypothetical protein
MSKMGAMCARAASAADRAFFEENGAIGELGSRGICDNIVHIRIDTDNDV